METRTTLQSRKGESSGAFASRGRRSIVPGSPGSKASTKPSVTASTRLIHKIWVAVIGKVKPMRIASTTATASPPLVGRVDRKSVVWGKSVSVRVDLGGGRVIKKKKN